MAELAGKPGAHLFEELRWVHGRIRHDLALCEDLARRVAAGLPGTEAREEIRALQTNGPLWKLRVNCLYYCRFVHSHHRAEDVLLFPAVRASDIRLAKVVDRLEADHRTVADRLDAVEAAAEALVEGDAAGARALLVAALGELRSDLLAHLDYEEESIGPTILEWEAWPLERRGPA